MNPTTERPTLIGYLPPLGGIRKTGANYPLHSSLVNIGDIAYTYAGTMLTCGRNFKPWNFTMSAAEVNETCSRVIFFIPCRIAPPPFDTDGYPYEAVTQFIEQLKIPFFSLSESIQSEGYGYEANFHCRLSPKVQRYLHTIADHSPLVGARGNYSAEVLHKSGIRNVETLGCPSLYINGPQLNPGLLERPEKGNVRNVAVCYSNYQGNTGSRIADVLGMAVDNGYHYVEQTFALATKALCYPGKIEASDFFKARHIYRDVNNLAALLEAGHLRYFTNYRLWREFLGSMDFAFGARMHGLTPALQEGVPSLFIAHDARVREMCEFFKLPFVAEQDLPERIDLDWLLSTCDYAPAHSHYPSLYTNYLATLARIGIATNTTAEGTIVDFWEPQPDEAVRAEESSITGPAEAEHFRKLLTLANTIPDDHFKTIEAIKSLSQAWYKSAHPIAA